MFDTDEEKSRGDKIEVAGRWCYLKTEDNGTVSLTLVESGELLVRYSLPNHLELDPFAFRDTIRSFRIDAIITGKEIIEGRK